MLVERRGDGWVVGSGRKGGRREGEEGGTGERGRGRNEGGGLKGGGR